MFELLPQPRVVRPGPGQFVVPDNLRVTAPPSWAAIARRLLSPGTGLELPESADGALTITSDQQLGPEAYRLAVTPGGVDLRAADNQGVNWGLQTLRQLLPSSVLQPAPIHQTLALPSVEIEDQPRFSWRGVMLDVGRHFMPLAGLFRFVDLLAMHKYNVFHLHLSEDQGWRFESRRHPRLNELSSWRSETRRPHDDHGDGTPHGGFYTQDQLRSLVTYAAQRGVTIVPELEFPGHVRGVLAAYPELGNDPARRDQTATTFGVFSEVLNMSDEAMSFVFDLYEELLDVFPSRYVHVGGDECPRSEWLQSPAAKQLAADRGLSGPDQLQHWFTAQLRDWLAERGRSLVGWDEIGDQGPLRGAVAMAWRDASYGVTAAAGMQVVMAPQSHTYFNFYPSDDAHEPHAIGGLITTEQAYAFDPLAGVPASDHDSVLGTQCQVWTEYLPSASQVDYMLFPRACAHSEVAWSPPEGRSWSEFRPRLAAHLARLDALGVNYRPESGPRPWQQGGTGYFRRAISARGRLRSAGVHRTLATFIPWSRRPGHPWLPGSWPVRNRGGRGVPGEAGRR